MELLQSLAIIALPLILAVTLHEAAHGWIADKLGDPTARSLGRITLNPIPHIDPLGTIVLPLGLFAVSTLVSGHGMLFGWAKPVPVMAGRLRSPRRDMALVAMAGPGANLLMALAWGVAAGLVKSSGLTLGMAANFLLEMAIYGVFINVILLVINLLPILPLDGGRVLASVLPRGLAGPYARLEPWGLVVLLALLLSGALGPFIMPMIFGLWSGILRTFGLA